MNWTGLIFGVIAALWLVYLVPLFLHRGDSGLLDEVEPGEPFSASVTIVRRGESLETAEDGVAIVSTPFNRRAALRELADIDREAARRRRRVLLALILATTIVGGLSASGVAVVWAAVIPAGLIVAFLGVARFSVRAMRRDLDARAALIAGRSFVDETTVAIPLLDDGWTANEDSVELTAPVEMTGSLWDPIPVTSPTYVSRPLGGRTVRTIDLSAPVGGVAVPVTADAPDEASDAAASDERRTG